MTAKLMGGFTTPFGCLSDCTCALNSTRVGANLLDRSVEIAAPPNEVCHSPTWLWRACRWHAPTLTQKRFCETQRRPECAMYARALCPPSDIGPRCRSQSLDVVGRSKWRSPPSRCSTYVKWIRQLHRIHPRVHPYLGLLFPRTNDQVNKRKLPQR